MKLLVILILSAACVFAQESPIKGKIENGKYTTADGSVTIPLPKDAADDSLRDMVDPQGITSQSIIVCKDKNLYGLFTTKIREQFPKSDKILLRTASRYRQNIRAEDGSTLEFIKFHKTADRRCLISVVRHIERGKSKTVKDKWLKTDVSMTTDVLEARVYMVHKGYFLEFKRIYILQDVLNTGPKNEDEISKVALKQVFEFVKSSNVMTQKEKEDFDKFDLKQQVVRGVFKDPSLD